MCWVEGQPEAVRSKKDNVFPEHPVTALSWQLAVRMEGDSNWASATILPNSKGTTHIRVYVHSVQTIQPDMTALSNSPSSF